MRLTLALAVALAAALPAPTLAESAAEARARGDALRKAGDLDGAVRAFEAALAAGDLSSEAWKRLGWAEKARRRFAAAEAALEKAAAADPGDREAQDDLADLRRSRGVRLNGWLGGDEPGSSKQALNAELWYGGLDRLELKAGYGYSDAIFYQSNKGFATAYWFYSPDSYLQADFTYRQYSYPVELGGATPNPDTSSYKQAPRGTLELQHWFGKALRATLGYQLYAPTFWHDGATRITNHKVSAEAMLPLGGGFQAGALLGALRDPDPRTTDILGRPLPSGSTSSGVDCTPPGAPAPVLCATRTQVKYRTEPLFGGFVAFQASRWGVELKAITNRDLDASYAYSLLTTLGLQPSDRSEATLTWVHDSYASVSAFARRSGDVLWASGRYWVHPSLAVGGGLKWVNNPSPQSRTDSGWRNSATLLLNLEYRTGLF